MRKKRIISLMFALVMLLSMTAYGENTNNWYDEAIENAVTNDLFNRDTAEISAKEHLLRSEMAAVINRAFGSTLKSSLDSFADVSKDAWYYDDMAKAVKMGTFKGSEGKLYPESKITREEVFTVLARATMLNSTDLTSLDKFSDAALISSWAKEGTAAMIKAGYIKGDNSKLNPKANITRAEFAQIIYNMINGYIKSSGTYTTVPNGSILINTPKVVLKDVTVTGDLILGDGVGDGEITLDNVKVIGRTVVRAGSADSIKIIGNSDLGTVVGADLTVKPSATNSTSGSGSGGSNHDEETQISISNVKLTAAENSNKITVTANINNVGDYDTAKIALISSSIKDVKAVSAFVPETEESSIKNKINYYAPIINGKINLTIYGLSNTKYSATVYVGETYADSSNFAVVYSPISAKYYVSSFSEIDLDNSNTGIEFYVHADETIITGNYTDYVYSVIAKNKLTGTEETLISNKEFESTEFEDLFDDWFFLTCSSDDFFKLGKYIIITQIKSSAADNSLIGESTFEIAVNPAAPDLKIDYINECINGYNIETMEYATYDPYFGWNTDTDWSENGSLKDIIDSKGAIYFRYTANESTPASEYKYFYISSRPEEPADLSTISANGENNGKIILLSSSNYEYKLFNSDTWIDENIIKTDSAETYEISDLSAGTYYVREKATDSSFASAPTTITVFEEGSTEPAAPKIVSVSLNSDFTKIYLKFDKVISETGLEKSNFKAYCTNIYYYSYNIESVNLKQNDATTIEILLSTPAENFPVALDYTSGTALSTDGGIIETFIRKFADNMYFNLSLASGEGVDYNTIALEQVNELNYYNTGLGYVIYDTSTSIPDSGTNIDSIDDVCFIGAWNYPIIGNIESGSHFALYSYDSSTGIISGFGQVEIEEENIGKKCNIIKDKFESINYSIVNETTKYAMSFGSIGENQTVTIGGTNDDDVSVTTSSGIQAYILDTSDIAKTGGKKSFTLTLSGDDADGQINGTYTMEFKLYPKSPIIEVDTDDNHKLNISGADPNAKISLCIIKNGYWSNFKETTADANGNASFEGLEAYRYFVYQTPVTGPGSGIDSMFTSQVEITD